MNVTSLRDTRTVVLDGSGNGSVSFGPQYGGTQWVIQRMSVIVSSNTNEPEANVYRNTIGQGSLISGTYSGSNDTDSQVNDGPLYPGESYICRWTGGDPGATASITFYGEQYDGI